MNASCVQIVNRSAFGRRIATATLLELVSDMDDLALQFAGTDLAHRFQAAWKRARIIVDNGCDHGGEDKPVPLAASE